MNLWLVLFVLVETLGIVIAIAWLHDAGTPFPERPTPHYIFRLVKRDERAVYARIMHRTLAVQMRDLNRAIDRSARAIGKAFLPTIQRLAAAFDGLFEKKP